MFRWKRMQVFVVTACVSLVMPQILSGPPCSMAQGSATEDDLSAEIGKIDYEATKDANKAEEALQEQFGVAKEEIQTLLGEKLSYGNIAALLAASSISGKTRQDVLVMVKSGKNWGEIANQLGGDLGVILAKTQEVGNKLGAEATARPKRKMKFAPGT